MFYLKYLFPISTKFALLFVTVLFFLACTQKTEREPLIQGKVTAGGNGIGNVVVTDGYRCVVTDRNGSFSFEADPDAGFVYVSTPVGYLPEEKMNLPQFYQPIEREKEKRYDFQLTENPEDDENHLLLVHADPQFHKEENFQTYGKVVEDIQQLKTGYPDRDILGIDCGDLVGDKPELYPLYIEHLNRTEIPFYRLPGNHDLQFGGRTTESSTQRYEETFGPDHYSFNRGQIHYIVLNNVFYLGRDYFYMGYIDEKTFKWLEQDLSDVPEGSTLIVSMHIPGRLDEGVKPFQYDSRTISAQTSNISSLFEILNPYKVHLLTGHMHYNRNIIHSENLYEHNTGAVSGAWWQGDYCLDGTPIGYGVYEINGSEVTWYYKSVGQERDHQMRVYAPSSTRAYGDDVVANIWNWDKNWRVEWFEDGEYMGEMSRFEGLDPEVDSSYSDKEKLEFSWIAPVQTDHLFRATPQKKDAEIKITAKDTFGNVYTETIQRQ
jgi:hypothetical protein